MALTIGGGINIGGGISITPVDSTAPAIGSTVSTQSPTLAGGTSIAALTSGTSPTSPFSTAVNAYQLNNSVTGYFTVPGSASWAFGTGDFTIEWFQNETDSNSFPRIFSIDTYPNQKLGCSIEGGTFYVWATGASSFGTITTYKNIWQHFAIVRNSGSLKVYRQGVALTAGTANVTNLSDSTTTLTFGNELSQTASSAFGGYLTNIRVCKGLAVYTGNFTVPTSPLGQTQSANPYGGSNTSAITNQCVLLLNP
jgi:hypothetical protein